MSTEQLNLLHSETVKNWLLAVNLSKPIRNFAKDFSDGGFFIYYINKFFYLVLVAEIIAHFLPRFIALGNFSHVNSLALKRYNWETLQKYT